jgi:hypothetical protein
VEDDAGQMLLVEQGSGAAYRRLPNSTLLWPVGVWKNGRLAGRQQQPAGAPCTSYVQIWCPLMPRGCEYLQTIHQQLAKWC